MTKRKSLEKVVGSDAASVSASLFDEVGQEYLKMEKDFEKDRIYAVTFRSIKIVLKMMWGAFRWMIQSIREAIHWIRERNQGDQVQYFSAN